MRIVCHFGQLVLRNYALQGVKGPMLKQMRPAKFKLPVSYVDLNTKEELPVPEVMQRANSTKFPSLPAKIAKRRARIRSLKTTHAATNGIHGHDKPAHTPPSQPRPQVHFRPKISATWFLLITPIQIILEQNRIVSSPCIVMFWVCSQHTSQEKQECKWHFSQTSPGEKPCQLMIQGETRSLSGSG